MSAAATSAPGASGVVVRVVEEGDMERLVRMLARLSPESAYRRFFTAMPKLTSGFLRSLVTVDDERGEVVVAVERDEIVGLGSFHRDARAPAVAHVAVLVEDRWQHRGLGRELVTRLARVARQGGVERFHADVLAENRPAVRLIQELSPGQTGALESGTLSYDLPLSRAA